jgi:hypothetical protein
MVKAISASELSKFRRIKKNNTLFSSKQEALKEMKEFRKKGYKGYNCVKSVNGTVPYTRLKRKYYYISSKC